MQSNRFLRPHVVVPAMAVLFGMHFLRALPPLLQYLLGDRLGWSSIQLGLAGLVVFAAAFFTGWFNRRLGLRRWLLITAGGLSITRLAAQLWPGDPAITLALVGLGVALFLLFLPACLARIHGQSLPAQAGQQLGLALLAGLTLDAALHGAFLTFDLIWQRGPIPAILILGLAAIQVPALRALLADTPPHPAPREASFGAVLPWLAFGPFLFLQLVFFQNPARLAALTGWSLPAAFAGVLASHLLGLTLAASWEPRRAAKGLLGLALLAALWPWVVISPLATAGLLVIGQSISAILLAAILRGLGQAVGRAQSPQNTALRRTTLIHGAGAVLLVGLLFAYYVTFDLPVPYEAAWLPLGAGLAVILAGLNGQAVAIKHADMRRWGAAWLLLLLPALLWLTTPAANPATAANTIRVMNYNLHNGFNTGGALNIDALAGVLEAQQPDIIMLQEVSRGWVVNGSLDAFNWLARRLKYPYAYFTPSSDALWGMAILSRYPIVHAEDHPMPPRSLPLKRSFTYAQIDTGQTQPLHVINAHYHHLEKDSAIRMAQTQTVLDFLAGRDLTQFILTGDLNATPDASEIMGLYQRDFVDVVTHAGLTPGYTYPAAGPTRRLDYILISPDLAATNVVIPSAATSDHLGIAATIAPALP
jgi:endonuclease/exonuclease/phosphatase family metal-dependent hydrolase